MHFCDRLAASWPRTAWYKLFYQARLRGSGLAFCCITSFDINVVTGDCASMAAYAVPTGSRSCSHRLLALSGTSTAHHRKAQSRGFLMMYGTNSVDEKKRSSLLYGPNVPYHYLGMPLRYDQWTT